jgi:hypothetical protein
VQAATELAVAAAACGRALAFTLPFFYYIPPNSLPPSLPSSLPSSPASLASSLSPASSIPLPLHLNLDPPSVCMSVCLSVKWLWSGRAANMINRQHAAPCTSKGLSTRVRICVRIAVQFRARFVQNIIGSQFFFCYPLQWFVYTYQPKIIKK